MIENIRKYKGLIFLGLALVVFGLVLGIKDDLLRGGVGGQQVLKIDGRTYNDKELSKLGNGGLDLISAMFSRGDYGMFQFQMALAAGATTRDDAVEKFFVSRMVLRDAMESLGVHPGDEEVAAYIKSMRTFAGPDSKFSEETYRTFVEKGIGRMGLTESDLLELVSDYLGYQKVTAIIGSGLVENRDAVAAANALENQQIAGELARLSIDPYVEKIQPTDEEIKTYWETIQDSFMTEELRKFTYVIVTPQMPADSEADKKDETIADAAMTDEQKKAKEEEKAKKAAELAETRRKEQLKTDEAVDIFSVNLEEQKGAGFEELAKANGWEVKTSELFPRSKPPGDLDVNLRSSSRGGKAADELFNIQQTSDPVSKISQPIAIGENQWLVARFDGEEKSRPKTFEEAKDEARDQYIQEKAAEAMKKAAEEALAKIKTAIEGGKTFADAAKEAGITETKSVEKVNSSYRPDPATEPTNLLEAGRHVDPGSFADLITEKDRTFIFHVTKREVVKEENADATLDSQVKATANTNQLSAFTDWLAGRIEAANVVQLYKQ
jgi:peptidyl-prolyl cis-trans isomerase D